MDGSVLKEKKGDDYDNSTSWKEHNFDIREEEEAVWGSHERDKGNSDNKDEDEESEEEEEDGKGDGSRM